MKPIELIWEGSVGVFVIEENDRRMAEMEIGISGNEMRVYHTEVDDSLQGKGVARELLDRAVEYARQEGKLIVPLCPYVLAQFKRHPDEFADVWKK